jgi:hypothetical protein
VENTSLGFARSWGCVVTVLVAGCSDPAPPLPANATKYDFRIRSERISRAEADLAVLFIGNSHTSTHDVPQRFAELVRADESGAKVFTKTCTSAPFLVGHSNNAETLEAIDNGPWDFVVLQAQKYSTSGKYHYPYDAALKLSKLAEQQGAQVIMFPEWGRQGSPQEAQRVQKLHEEVAEISGARVAPVGLAWDRAQAAHPRVQFHQDDGNHASQIGAYLTACVLYATITSRNPEELPSEGDLQSSLQSIAWETVSSEAKP